MKLQFSRGFAHICGALMLISSAPSTSAAPVLADKISVRAINFSRFPDGTPIPNETVITNQFSAWGVEFEVTYDTGPVVLTALDHVLISGRPMGFWGDTVINFVNGCSPKWVEIDMIGSAVGIGATLTQLEGDYPVQTTTAAVNWTSGVPLPIAIAAPAGSRITRLKYNGSLGPNGAASMGALRYGCE